MISFFRFVFFSFLLIPHFLWAGGSTCQSNQSGNWEDPAIWDLCAGPPNGASFVTVKASHVVTLSGDTAQLHQLTLEANAELIIADVAGGVTILTSDAGFDSTLGVLTLLGDLTITGLNDNITLGTVDGAAGLTLNSDLETRFIGTIGVNTALSSLVTDAAGTLVFDNAQGDENNANIVVNGPKTFNDPITLMQNTHINGEAQITFASTIDGFRELFLSGNFTEVTFNEDVGLITPLAGFKLFNAAFTTAQMNMASFTTQGPQQWDVFMVVNSPTSVMTLLNTDTNSDLRLFQDHGLGAQTAFNHTFNAVSARGIYILGDVSNVGLSLNELNLTANSEIIIEANIVSAFSSMTFNGPVRLVQELFMRTGVFDFQNPLDNGGFQWTMQFQGNSNISTMTGDLSGSGDFIKRGTGTLLIEQAKSITGDVYINEGVLEFTAPLDNPFPDSSNIYMTSISTIKETNAGLFDIKSGQTLNDLGACDCQLNVSPLGRIVPGANPGIHTTNQLSMADNSTLTLFVFGTTPGSGYDQYITEALTLDNTTLSVSGAKLQLGAEYNLIDVTGMSPVSGEFNGFSESDYYVLGNQLVSLSYVGGDGNDVVLRVIKNDNKFFVKANLGNRGLSDGLSWDTAFSTLQDALAVAPNGSEIWVAQGVYYPDEGTNQVNDSLFSIFELVPGVSLYGGFVGDETDLNARDPFTHLTILSGDIDGNDINTDDNGVAENVDHIQGANTYQILNGEAVDTSVMFDGFIVTAGDSVNRGAGMNCGTASIGPAINQVMFIGNRADDRGAATVGCTQQVSNTQYINNEAGDLAGAVLANGGYMESVVFEGNFASIQAGALLNSSDLLTIINGSFIGNSNGQGAGGAIRGDADLYIESSLFLGNKGKDGGAIRMITTHDLELVNVTITGNRATGKGGGIYSNGSGGLSVINSIIWNNQDNSGLGTMDASILYEFGLVNNQWSLIQGWGTTGNFNLDEDPLFYADTDPSDAPTVVGNSRLVIGSPALNAGNNAAVITQLDLDGEDRIQDTTVDMGAYEGILDLIFAGDFETIN